MAITQHDKPKKKKRDQKLVKNRQNLHNKSQLTWNELES